VKKGKKVKTYFCLFGWCWLESPGCCWLVSKERKKERKEKGKVAGVFIRENNNRRWLSFPKEERYKCAHFLPEKEIGACLYFHVTCDVMCPFLSSLGTFEHARIFPLWAKDFAKKIHVCTEPSRLKMN